MKIRQGFVSNSSTSSFVLLGIEIKDKYSEQEMIDIMTRAGYNYSDNKNIETEFNCNFPDSIGINIHSGSEDGIDGGCVVAGYRLANEENSYFSLTKDKFSLSELTEMNSNLKYIFDTNQDAALYAGTRMS